jgi:flagellar motor switch protein FliN/FliY
MPLTDQTTDAPAGSTAGKPASGSGVDERVLAAGEAVAPLLPAGEAVTLGVPQPPALLVPTEWAAAGVVALDRVEGAVVGLLVRQDLADALAAAPAGGLEVGAALQPALDAAAVALGSPAGAAQTLAGEELAATVTAADAALPLLAGGETAAVLFVAGLATPGDAGEAAAGLRGTQGSGTPRPGRAPVRGVELLHGVSMEVTVELGRTRMSVRELLALAPGDVLELDRAAGSPADLLVNGRLIARGEVVVVDEDFALRVTEIVAPSTGA